MLVMNAVQLFVLLYVAKMFIFSENIYHSFGFVDTPIFIGLLLFLSAIWENLDLLLDILMNTISRKYEYQADRFATEHGYGHHLKVALTKLNVENSSSIASHWLVSLVRNSHPSLL